MATNFDIYTSPYSWRYGSDEMRHVWGEINVRKTWRFIWTKLAEIQANFGLVTKEQTDDLNAHANEINIHRSLEIENEIKHDLVAELKTFTEQCRIGGSILHLGATSMDIKDNAEILIIHQSLNLIISKLTAGLRMLCENIKEWAYIPVIGITHLQPAEPTTLGYRFASLAQDLYSDWCILNHLYVELKAKGFTGAVGTSASFMELVGKENLKEFTAQLSGAIGLPFYDVTSQVYPRKFDYGLACALAGLGASLYKFSFDNRILQSPGWGEIAEAFERQQVGSSAMPFKKNPINAEKISSLARILKNFTNLAWDNAAHSLLERTLDDSANRRSFIPEMFLISDELLITFNHILDGLQVNHSRIRNNLKTYGPFASIEKILTLACKAGADRQQMHEKLRLASLEAWGNIEKEGNNSLFDILTNDPEITKYISKDTLDELVDISTYIGDAPERATKLANKILKIIQ